ncbi:MAG: AI-2E family transporter [Anaerolineae bacterium]|nr:AI-2E family transporter [Anaerolineae bacterium]
MKQLMKYTAVILTTLTVLLVLWQFKLALLLFVLSLFVAAAIRPFVDGLVARGLPKGAAQLLLYVVGIGGFVLVLLLVGEWWWQELNLAVNQAVVEYESLYRRWQLGAGWQQTAVNLLPPFTFTGTELQQVTPTVITITSSLTGTVAGLLVLLALSIYWSVDQSRFERLWLSLLPVKRRAYARDSWREVETAVAGYLRSQTVQKCVGGLLLAVARPLSVLNFPCCWLLWEEWPLLCPCLVGCLRPCLPLAWVVWKVSVWAWGWPFTHCWCLSAWNWWWNRACGRANGAAFC